MGGSEGGGGVLEIEGGSHEWGGGPKVGGGPKKWGGPINWGGPNDVRGV